MTKKKNVNYGNNQIAIHVIGSSEEDLKKKVHIFTESLYKVGIASIKEDIAIEDCFFSALPGNFQFIKRSRPLKMNNIGG